MSLPSQNECFPKPPDNLQEKKYSNVFVRTLRDFQISCLYLFSHFFHSVLQWYLTTLVTSPDIWAVPFIAGANDFWCNAWDLVLNKQVQSLAPSLNNEIILSRILKFGVLALLSLKWVQGHLPHGTLGELKWADVSTATKSAAHQDLSSGLTTRPASAHLSVCLKRHFPSAAFSACILSI